MIDIRIPQQWRQTGIVKSGIAIMFFDNPKPPRAQAWLQQAFNPISPDKQVALICRPGNPTVRLK